MSIDDEMGQAITPTAARSSRSSLYGYYSKLHWFIMRHWNPLRRTDVQDLFGRSPHVKWRGQRGSPATRQVALFDNVQHADYNSVCRSMLLKTHLVHFQEDFKLELVISM